MLALWKESIIRLPTKKENRLVMPCGCRQAAIYSERKSVPVYFFGFEANLISILPRETQRGLGLYDFMSRLPEATKEYYRDTVFMLDFSV